jgi:hypothetical protein
LVTGVAGGGGDEAGFFAGLGEAGLLVRLRFSDADPGQVTGYSVALPGHGEEGRAVAWCGGGRLAQELSLPRLRQAWGQGRSGVPGRSGAAGLTAPERDAIYQHAARQAGLAAGHVRRCVGGDPGAGADAAWAAADALHMAARAVGSPALQQAAEAYDRAARARYGRVPKWTGDGQRLRAMARLMGLLGGGYTAGAFASAGLLANLAGLADAVAELRQAQQHAAQAAAARSASAHLHAELARIRSRPPGRPRSQTTRPPSGRSRQAARTESPVPARLDELRIVPDATPRWFWRGGCRSGRVSRGRRRG